jgi:hypothetical protein
VEVQGIQSKLSGLCILYCRVVGIALNNKGAPFLVFSYVQLVQK